MLVHKYTDLTNFRSFANLVWWTVFQETDGIACELYVKWRLLQTDVNEYLIGLKNFGAHWWGGISLKSVSWCLAVKGLNIYHSRLICADGINNAHS
jgi:hypothetical protein